MPKRKNFCELSRRQQNRRIKQMQSFNYVDKENMSEVTRTVEVKSLHVENTSYSALNVVVDNALVQQDVHDNLSAPNIVTASNTTDMSTLSTTPYSVPHTDRISLRQKLILWTVEHKIQHISLTSLLNILKSEGHDLPCDGRTLMKTPKCTNICQKSGGYYYHHGLKNGIIDVLCQLNNYALQNPILINVNIDGLPIAKSSKSQLWPILAQMFVEGPPIIIIVGVYHGYNKPTDINFLQDFITEYKELSEIGITFQNKTYKVKIRAIICDSPARALVTCTKGHNGYFGCSKCTIEGSYANHRMLFFHDNCSLRTDEMFKLRHTPEHHTGVSLFEQIPLPMVTTFPLDYMHLVLLGAMKKLIKLWLKGPICIEARLSGEQIKTLTLDMTSLRKYICSEFVRVPSSFEDIDKWKATEYRIFLLYLAPVLLHKYLPSIYMKHFLAFHCAIRILCHPQDYMQKNQYAKELLLYFVQKYPLLYGKENMIYTVHNLIHLSDDAKRFGPLDTFSAFPFENYLHTLKKLLRKHEKPLQQIDRRITENYIANTLKTFTNEVKYPILISRNNKTIPFECSDSYDKLQFRNFKLSCCKLADCFCFLKTKNIVMIHYIGLRYGHPVIIGKEFLNYSCYNSYPCDSRHIDIFMVNEKLSELKYFPVTDILRKAVVLPWEGGQYCVFPLLHSD